VKTSNVDKVPKADESPVRLCNYVDVYRHDYIRSDLSFMVTTATADEIERFRLAPGDVVVTKDSEDWRDIGKPALVCDSAPDLVCGYHLAMLRPRGAIDGAYLHRCLQASAVNCQWQTRATGVTRYGLSQKAIKDLRLPLPPPEDQRAIAKYLRVFDHGYRTLVQSKRQILQSLSEQRSAIVDGVVARGLAHHADHHPAPFRGLDQVPAHWDIRPMKRHFREIDERSPSGTEEILSVSHLTGVSPRSEKAVTMFMAASYVGHKMCRPGDLVINTMWAWMGALGISPTVGLVSPSYGVYRIMEGSALLPEYAEYLLSSAVYVAEYTRRSTGIQSSRLRLYPDAFLRMPMVCPPPDEQRAIVAFIRTQTEATDRAVDEIRASLAHAEELRERLIEDVVLGRLDVRKAAAALSDFDAVDIQPVEQTVLDEGEPDDEGAGTQLQLA
jgi:type I restriction enzyme S subunit